MPNMRQRNAMVQLEIFMHQKLTVTICIITFLLLFPSISPGDNNMENTKHRTDWFKQAKWGVFTHYLTGEKTSAEDWNRQVDSFDVKALAKQLKSTGARYYFITLGQNSGHYCSPNAAYDKYVGISPGKCSKRDLVADLYDALNPLGIKLMVYLPSGAPAADPIAMEKLKWVWGFKGNWPSWTDKWPNPNDPNRTGNRLVEFQRMWEEVIREWSTRWGKKVCGWWIDGCYFPNEMYRYPDAPNFQSFADALRAGNPDSIVAFNPGVFTPVQTMTDQEDYTAGEIADALPVCPGDHVEKAQYHILSYLGSSWCSGKPRFKNELAAAYTLDVTDKGGVITWDVPINSKGQIPQEFIDQLMYIGKKVK